MSDLVAGFNADDVKPQESFEPVPAGWYKAFISDHETKRTNKGDGQYLELVWEITGPKFENRKVWDRLNLDNPNATAVEIAQASLSAICRAVGVVKPKSADDLVGKEIEIKIAVKPAKGEYGPSNEVKGYREVGAAKAEKPALDSDDDMPF